MTGGYKTWSEGADERARGTLASPSGRPRPRASKRAADPDRCRYRRSAGHRRARGVSVSDRAARNAGEAGEAASDGSRPPVARALLLSGSLGAGHEVHARACAASLSQRGWSTEILDAMRLLGRRGGAAGEAIFRSMLAVPGLFDAFHFGALRPGGRLALLADAAARRKLVPQLRGYLDENPPELIISVFATGASAVSELADRYPGMSHVVFCSDVTPHRLWVHPHVDLYLVTSVAAEAAVRRYQPQAQVQVVAPPMRPGFLSPPSQEEARAALGLPAGDRCVMLMSGAWGLGPLADAAAGLADAGLQVLAVAGRNARLATRLRAAAGTRPRLHPFGFTDQIPTLMAAADLVITSSGDTCAEARTVGRPLLLLDVVPGHGRDNLQHELEQGDASVTSPRPADVVATALAALDRAKPPSSGRAHCAAWEDALSLALDSMGLSQLPVQGRELAGRAGCLHRGLDHFVHLGPLVVEQAQVTVKFGGGCRSRSPRPQDVGDIVLHPLGVGEGPGQQAIDGAFQVEAGQRLVDLVLRQ
ncbi:MAG: hypothetical protein J2P34_05975, partial [Actinobacteria bacterium]|nr:hypothetical protein [Actinomycetota bacterium]